MSTYTVKFKAARRPHIFFDCNGTDGGDSHSLCAGASVSWGHSLEKEALHHCPVYPDEGEEEEDKGHRAAEVYFLGKREARRQEAVLWPPHLVGLG